MLRLLATVIQFNHSGMVNTAVYTAVFSQTKGKCWKWRQCWQMKEKQIFELVLIPFLLLSDRRLAEVTSLDCICLHGCSVGFERGPVQPILFPKGLSRWFMDEATLGLALLTCIHTQTHTHGVEKWQAQMPCVWPGSHAATQSVSDSFTEPPCITAGSLSDTHPTSSSGHM